jgi:Chaperone of endosialidase
MFNSKFLGVLKHPGYNGKSSAPATPDYSGMAQQQSQAQKELNRETMSANRVNQVTPYGNLNYSQTGTDQYGNPTYTATQTLSPEQQAVLQKQSGLSSNLLGSANTAATNYANVLQNPQVDQSKLAQVGINPGETYSDAIMRRLQPQIQQESTQFETRMANQGIAPGTEAYENAKRSLTQSQNDKLTSAVVGGLQTGLAANQQGFAQGMANNLAPINTINAIRTGSQVQNPNYVNSAAQANTNAADLTGAAQQSYNANLAATNAANQQTSNFYGGLMGLGGAIFSDERLKENVKKVGALDNGLNLYSYNYKDGYDLPEGKQVGVMAQEVEKLIPEAIIEMANGFKAVNYALLGV